MPRPRLAAEDKSAFPLVCIGMSAGVVLPLKELFGALDAHTGMAFVIIHHLRKVPTLLPEILAKCTAMPVEFGFAGLNLQPNHVYVLPSGMEMSVADGFFLLQPRSKTGGWTKCLYAFPEFAFPQPPPRPRRGWSRGAESLQGKRRNYDCSGTPQRATS